MNETSPYTPADINVVAAEATLLGHYQLRPEFVDHRGLEKLFGIKRSLAYELLNSGAIKGVSLRKRGRCRGKRLFCAASVRAYLQSQIEEEVTK